MLKRYSIRLTPDVLLALILFITFPVVIFAHEHRKDANAVKTPYTVPKIEAEINIDGELDEEAWQNALILELKYEIEPSENTPAPMKTEVLLLYDNAKVYFAFRCYDPEPSQILAHLSDRDGIGADDYVAVNLDTFNDERSSIGISANPLGIQWDAYTSITGGKDARWDAIWNSAGKIFDWGYSVEMVVPFSAIRFQRSEGTQIWGFDAYRFAPRSVAHTMGLVERDRNNNCYQCQMVKIEGFEDVSPGRNLEINPTISTVKTDTRESIPDGDFATTNESAESGLTIQWGITPNLNVSATANPDFSQVEADARQLDINQRFTLSFAEKRPFFIEGSDFFKSPLNTIYTRSIHDPAWGLKLAGKEGDNSIGVYIVEDEVTNIVFPGSENSRTATIQDKSLASVFRFSRDIGSKYTVGALVTDREGDDYYNRIAGVDGGLRFTATDQLEFQFLGSSTLYPEKVAGDNNQEIEPFSDTAVNMTYTHSTRSWGWSAEYQDIGEGFRADLGFMPRAGYRSFLGNLDHQWIAQPGQWWSTLKVGGNYLLIEDQAGSLLNGTGSVFLSYSGAKQSSIYSEITKGTEAFLGQEFDITRIDSSLAFYPAANVHLSISSGFGDQVDYANSRPGENIFLGTALVSKFGDHFRIDFSHIYDNLTVNDIELYTANISQATIVYQFNKNAFVRAILQYVDYSYNTSNYIFPQEPEFRHLFSQFLFSYKLNPRTVLFLGYTDNFYGDQRFGLTQNDRTLFMKIGYAWQL